MLLDRVRNWFARASLPLVLLSLVVLLNPLSEDAGSTRCWHSDAARLLQELGPIETRFEGDAHMLVARVQGATQMTHAHFSYVLCLLIAFALAYLLLAPERLALRVSVFMGAMLAGFASAFVFVSIC